MKLAKDTRGFPLRHHTALTVTAKAYSFGPDPPDRDAATHRTWLQTRLLEAGPDALADHEVLEMMLSLGRPRGDARPLARALEARFGSHADAIAASPNELRTVGGIGESGVLALKIVQAAARRLVLADAVYRPTLSNWERLIDYLAAVLARQRTEQARALFLDRRNRLIVDEVQAEGEIALTAAYPRDLMERALGHHATALILVHINPDGKPAPTRAELAMTREIKRTATALSIVLHDHVIVGDGAWVSLKRLGLL